MTEEELARSLTKALRDALGALKSADIRPGETDDGLYIELCAERDDARWKALVRERLQTAERFEIHCWKDEAEWIDLALQYGALQESGWRDGTVVAGTVTPAFAELLLQLPKPADTEVYNKMTPFFNLFLRGGGGTFASSHYGTEIYCQAAGDWQQR